MVVFIIKIIYRVLQNCKINVAYLFLLQVGNLCLVPTKISSLMMISSFEDLLICAVNFDTIDNIYIELLIFFPCGKRIQSTIQESVSGLYIP